jgi:hypothetical protein
LPDPDPEEEADASFFLDLGFEMVVGLKVEEIALGILACLPLA